MTLVDMGVPGAGCSAGNAGWVVPALSGPIPAPGLIRKSLKWLSQADAPLYISPAAIPRLWSWLWQFRRHCNESDYRAGLEAVAKFNARTMASYDALEADGVSFEMHRDGILFAYLETENMEHLLGDLELLREFGYEEPMVVEDEAVQQLEPALSDQVACGVLVEQDRHVRPDTLMSGLLKRLREWDVEVLSGVEVIALDTQREGVAVKTTEGTLRADCALVAAGAWSAPLLRRVGVSLPIEAGKGYSITISEPAVHPKHALYLEEAKVACSPFRDGLRLAGTMELSGINTTLDERRVAAIRRAGKRYLAGWDGDSGAASTWVGMRSLTPDGLPVIGLLPGSDAIYLAAGHGMLGITLAPATAEALADQILAGCTDLPVEPFSPSRFVTS